METKSKKKLFQFALDHLGPDSKSDDIYSLQALLGRYGYLTRASSPGQYDEATREAVMQFQTFYRIYPDEDGTCDQETINILNQPRCGVWDPPPAHRSVTGRLSPFVTVGAKWDKLTLSYKYLNRTPDLSENRQREIVTEAFNRWSRVCALTFQDVPSNGLSDLSVGFHHGSHGDGASFDDAGGPDGNTLAHAFFPPPAGGAWAGSLHFDEFELWKDLPGEAGIRLYNVALHEIGHLLGLAHSQDTNAIMYAYYAEDRNALRADDIAGVQSLYGAPTEEPVAISPGQQISGHLPQTNAEVRYQVTLQNKLLFRLEGPTNQDFDLYVRYNEPVGKEDDHYDAVSYGITADELVTIENPKAGTYYILVHSYSGSGSYNLEVEIV